MCDRDRDSDRDRDRDRDRRRDRAFTRERATFLRNRNSGGSNSLRDNTEVEVDRRDEICSLTIRKVQAEHNGPWLCIAEDDDEDEDQQYVFLDVKNAGSKLELLTDQADQRVYEREGRDVVLECPTNAYSGFVKCTFTDPYGNDYLMVGSKGERYAHLNNHLKSSWSTGTTTTGTHCCRCSFSFCST